jgi:tetratricopeptide (TPR) repeat protein
MPVNAATILQPDEQPWYMIEKARIAFEQGDYGVSVRLAETAKRNKSKEYSWYVTTLSNELRAQQVQRVGDNITAATVELKARNSNTAVEIVAYFVDTYGADFFHNRVSELIAHISAMSVFPEADCIIGDVYAIEGDVELAREYYLKAWKNANAMEIPDAKYDILYSLADLALMQEDYDSFEQSLLLVLADDPYYNGTERVAENQGHTSSYLRSMIQSINRGYSVDRLFLMYRANTYRSLKALIMLTSYYKRNQDIERFLEMSVLGALTAFTRINEIVTERDINYAYTTVDNLFKDSLRYAEIQDWMTKNSVWDCFLSFAEAATLYGQNPLAHEIRRILINYAPSNIVAAVPRSQ